MCKVAKSGKSYVLKGRGGKITSGKMSKSAAQKKASIANASINKRRRRRR